MVGVEFLSPAGPAGQYDFQVVTGAAKTDVPRSMASRVAKKCVEKGMLLLTTSVYEGRGCLCILSLLIFKSCEIHTTTKHFQGGPEQGLYDIC
jgi:hypothetical protein